MRGDDLEQMDVFSYVSAEQRIAKDHPLRGIRGMVDEASAGDVFAFRRVVCARRAAVDCAGEAGAGASVAGAVLVKSERQLMEQIDYNLLFRWFVGLTMTMRSGM